MTLRRCEDARHQGLPMCKSSRSGRCPALPYQSLAELPSGRLATSESPGSTLSQPMKLAAQCKGHNSNTRPYEQMPVTTSAESRFLGQRCPFQRAISRLIFQCIRRRVMTSLISRAFIFGHRAIALCYSQPDRLDLYYHRPRFI